jgi:hypothetical protein
MFQPRLILVATIALAGYGCAVADVIPLDPVPSPDTAPDPFNVQVRATTHGADTVHAGTIIYLSADSLLMNSEDDGRRLAIPVPRIAKLEVYRGYQLKVEEELNGPEIGSLLGALGGALLAIFGGAITHPLQEPDVFSWGVDGALVGASIGAEIGRDGAAVPPGWVEVWEDVSVSRLREELCQCWLPELEAASRAA